MLPFESSSGAHTAMCYSWHTAKLDEAGRPLRNGFQTTGQIRKRNTMKYILSLASVLIILATAADSSLSQSREQREMRARIEAEAEQQRRERAQEDLKTATAELAVLTEMLVAEVADADGYTVSLEILESATRIEELAEQIEDLARRIHRRAQGR